MAGIKVPGIFIPGTVKGIVTEAKYIKGTYIVVNNKVERDSLNPNVTIPGTKVYIVDEGKEYIFTTSKKWKEQPTNEEVKLQIEGVINSLNDLSGKVDKKQDKLVSGDNIKTINGESILGPGNIDISGGSGDAHVVQVNKASELPNIPKDEHTVYFVKDEKATYMFDGLSYVCVGNNYDNIEIINGNFN